MMAGFGQPVSGEKNFVVEKGERSEKIGNLAGGQSVNKDRGLSKEQLEEAKV